MEPDTKNMRLVELVNELVGAQTMAKMISEATASLTDDQKRQITDAIFERTLASLQSKDTYAYQNICVDLVSKILVESRGKEHHAAFAARLLAAVKASVETRWQLAVDAEAGRWLSMATEAVRSKFDDLSRGLR